MKKLERWALCAVFCLLVVGAGAHGQDAPANEVAMIEATGDAAEQWPYWRGPSRQGHVPDSGYPDTWSDTENILWKTEVPGTGNSSPIVWGDRVFLTTAYNRGQRRSILCFRRSDGELLWETFAPDAEPERAHGKNRHASPTPATDGERVYAYFGNHGLLAVDFEGETVWHRPLTPASPFHGIATSPLLLGDRLFLHQAGRGEDNAFMAAYDTRTGEELWRTEHDAQRGWSTPVPVRVGERDLIIVNARHRTIAFHPDTGEIVWTARGNTNEPTPTPVVGHGLVYCSSGRQGPTFAIRPDGAGDVTETHVAWSMRRGSSFVPSTILVGDHLYMMNDMQSLAMCLDARTGETLWEEQLGEVRREGFSASPVAVDGKVFFTSDRGETFVLRAGAEFELLRVNNLNENVLASPALVGGRWYYRTENHLLAGGIEEE